MKTKLKKVTYNGLIYTVEEMRLRNNELFYRLSGLDFYVKESECTHWISGWFYKFFQGKWSKLFKN